MIRTRDGIRLKWTKRVRLDPPDARYLKAQLGMRAFRLIRDRVSRTGKLGTGDDLADYRRGWFIYDKDDDRFTGGEPTTMVMTPKGPRWTGEERSRVHKDGYEAAKSQKPHSVLTGAMWAHGRVTLGGNKNRQRLSVGFQGSVVVREKAVQVGTTKRGKPKFRMKRTRVRNQDKADALQRLDDQGHRTRLPQRALMSLERSEAASLLTDYMRGIRVLKSR